MDGRICITDQCALSVVGVEEPCGGRVFQLVLDLSVVWRCDSLAPPQNWSTSGGCQLKQHHKRINFQTVRSLNEGLRVFAPERRKETEGKAKGEKEWSNVRLSLTSTSGEGK